MVRVVENGFGDHPGHVWDSSGIPGSSDLIFQTKDLVEYCWNLTIFVVFMVFITKIRIKPLKTAKTIIFRRHPS